jgi:hypothetical protein
VQRDVKIPTVGHGAASTATEHGVNRDHLVRLDAQVVKAKSTLRIGTRLAGHNIRNLALLAIARSS